VAGWHYFFHRLSYQVQFFESRWEEAIAEPIGIQRTIRNKKTMENTLAVANAQGVTLNPKTGSYRVIGKKAWLAIQRETRPSETLKSFKSEYRGMQAEFSRAGKMSGSAILSDPNNQVTAVKIRRNEDGQVLGGSITFKVASSEVASHSLKSENADLKKQLADMKAKLANQS
jgi:hypothetical protein